MVLGFRFLASFSTLALVEGALLMIMAGGMDIFSSIFITKARQLVFGSKKEWSIKEQKSTQHHAVPYVVVGLFLLGEAILLSKL